MANVRDCGASGSKFQTLAATKNGSRQITVANVGDFNRSGRNDFQRNIRYERIRMWEKAERYRNMKPVNDSVEIRGYDGTAGSRIIYILDIAPSPKPAFRWTDDLGHTWHDEAPITHGWQAISGGVEVKLNARDWESGYVIAFGARDFSLSLKLKKLKVMFSFSVMKQTGPLVMQWSAIMMGWPFRKQLTVPLQKSSMYLFL